jgi:uncharacterized protein (DUF736 family)
MTALEKDLTGALFRNERKLQPNSPDYNGSVRVDGRNYTIAGWLKISKAGLKYMSLSLKEKPEETASRPVPEKSADMNDELGW